MLPSPTNIRKKAIQESVRLSLMLLAFFFLLITIVFCEEHTWRKTMNSAIFCPNDINPNNVVEKYHEYHLIKVLDKNTDEIKKSYGENYDVRLRFLGKDSFVTEVSVLEDSKTSPKTVLVMHKIDSDEYLCLETRYKNFNNKDWGLKR